MSYSSDILILLNLLKELREAKPELGRQKPDWRSQYSGWDKLTS
jgi:hypothetical protein